MDTPGGRRYRWWQTTGDAYCCVELTRDECVDWALSFVWRGPWSREWAEARLDAMTDDDHQVASWFAEEFCPTCGGWSPQGAVCYPDDPKRCAW